MNWIVFLPHGDLTLLTDCGDCRDTTTTTHTVGDSLGWGKDRGEPHTEYRCCGSITFGLPAACWVAQRMLRGISQLFKAISTSLVPMHRTVEADAPWTSAFWLRRDHSGWSLAHSWEAGVKGFLWQSWGRNSESGPCKLSDPEPGPCPPTSLRTHVGETEEREMSKRAASQGRPFSGKLTSKLCWFHSTLRG